MKTSNSKKSFIEKLKNFSDNFSLTFYIMLTTLFIAIILVTFAIAEYTRLHDGLKAIFPDKPDFVIVGVSFGILIAYATMLGIKTITKIENNDDTEYRTKHSLFSRIASLGKTLFGKAEKIKVTKLDKIVSRLHLFELGIIFISISGTIYWIIGNIFDGQDISIANSFSFIINNITLEEAVNLISVLIFSLMIIYGFEPFISFAIIEGRHKFMNDSATKANEVFSQFKALGYKELNILKLEHSRIDLSSLDELNNNYNLLFKLYKKENTPYIGIADVKKKLEYNGDFSNNTRTKTIEIIKEKLANEAT